MNEHIMREITIKTLVGGSGGVGKTTIIHISSNSISIFADLKHRSFSSPDISVP